MSDAAEAQEVTELERVIEIEPEALEAASRAAEQAIAGLNEDARWELFAREIRLALLEDDERMRRIARQEWYLLSLFANVAPAVSRVMELGDWRALRVGAVPIDEWMRVCRDAARHAEASPAPNQETDP